MKRSCAPFFLPIPHSFSQHFWKSVCEKIGGETLLRIEYFSDSFKEFAKKKLAFVSSPDRIYVCCYQNPLILPEGSKQSRNFTCKRDGTDVIYLETPEGAKFTSSEFVGIFLCILDYSNFVF